MVLLRTTALGLVLSLGLFNFSHSAASFEDASTRTVVARVGASRASTVMDEFLRHINEKNILTPAQRAESFRQLLTEKDVNTVSFSKTAVQKAFMAWKTPADISNHTTDIFKAAGISITPTTSGLPTFSGLTLDDWGNTASSSTTVTSAGPRSTEKTRPRHDWFKLGEEDTTPSLTTTASAAPDASGKVVFLEHPSLLYAEFSGYMENRVLVGLPTSAQYTEGLKSFLLEKGYITEYDYFDTSQSQQGFLNNQNYLQRKGTFLEIIQAATGVRICQYEAPHIEDPAALGAEFAAYTQQNGANVYDNTQWEKIADNLEQFLKDKGLLIPGAPFNKAHLESPLTVPKRALDRIKDFYLILESAGFKSFGNVPARR